MRFETKNVIIVTTIKQHEENHTVNASGEKSMSYSCFARL